jgi:hypothetical protein
MEVHVGEARRIGELTVFPLIGRSLGAPPLLTGPEAFAAGLLEICELDPPEVPKLMVLNHSDLPVLLVEGEMLIGGDQNRTMNVTVLCAPHSTTIVPVSCVEAGRWGARRAMYGERRHAPGSLRSAKVAFLEERGEDRSARSSDQSLVWHEVDRHAEAHTVRSETAALDDVQDTVEQRIADDLDALEPEDDQLGVICAAGDGVVGLDLFDRSSALGSYHRSIVAGHALDAIETLEIGDPLAAVEAFLAEVGRSGFERGAGVGLGEEVLVRGQVSGVGLSIGEHLVHLASFPQRTGFDI